MLSERTIINALVLVAGLILGPYMVITMLEGDGLPLFILGVIAFLMVIFFGVRDGVCILPLLGLSFVGRLNFLPLGFTALEVSSLILILYYIVAYLAMRQRPINGGPLRFLIPILTIGAIVLYHDHSIGLHVMGSSQEGSRPGLLLFIAIVTYVCGINIPTPATFYLKRLPWYAVCMTSLSMMPFIVTTYFPSLTPFFYHFTDAVNVDAYFSTGSAVSGSAAEVGRAGFQAAIGAALQVFLVSHFPIYKWWRPDRWLVAILSFLCFCLVVSGGYRSGLMLFVFVTFVGACCYSSWRVFILVLPLMALGAAGLSLVQEDHPMGLQLPLIAQRSLTFLPGNWDEEAIESAKSSNDFRNNIQRVYMKEYMFKSPLIGNGFTFDPREAEILINMAGKSDTYDHYYQAKSFIITKTFHVGWISLYDAVGLIGCLSFIMLGVGMLWTLGTFIFHRNVDQYGTLFPLKVWLFCNISQSLFGYFTVFGNFSSTLPGLCASAIVLVHLDKIERRESQERLAPPHRQAVGQPRAGRLFPA